MKVLDQPLAFVDIETSGENWHRGRIIEIGVVRVHGSKVETYQSLVNPDQPLPEFITSLTGIRDTDLWQAPTFAQISAELSHYLEGAIFVAHNARFDYSFVTNEFKRLGLPFRPKTLCTVRLSRLLYPGYRGHSLDKLIQRFNFQPEARHRALADAMVLWEFVQHALAEFGPTFVNEAMQTLLKHQSLPAGLSSQLIDGLPNTPGVYIFEDAAGLALYVGKSVDIRTRVLAHFSADSAIVKEMRLAQTVKHISWHQTAGELGALILENSLIKQLQPIQNRLQRRVDSLVSVTGETDASGYLHLQSRRLLPAEIPNLAAALFGIFRSEKRAQAALAELAKAHHLCNKLLSLERGSGACFAYQLGYCLGACTGQEPPDSYNQRLRVAFTGYGVDDWPYASPILVSETGDDGRSEAFVIDRWCLVGQTRQDAEGAQDVTASPMRFDLDTYKLLRRFITNPKNRRKLRPIQDQELRALGLNTSFS